MCQERTKPREKQKKRRIPIYNVGKSVFREGEGKGGGEGHLRKTTEAALNHCAHTYIIHIHICADSNR